MDTNKEGAMPNVPSYLVIEVALDMAAGCDMILSSLTLTTFVERSPLSVSGFQHSSCAYSDGRELDGFTSFTSAL